MFTKSFFTFIIQSHLNLQSRDYISVQINQCKHKLLRQQNNQKHLILQRPQDPLSILQTSKTDFPYDLKQYILPKFLPLLTSNLNQILSKHMNVPNKIPLQLQKERQQRHIKLMKMINSYELNRQEKNKLQKIKSHTMMEINLRYLRSQINRNYKFPKFSQTILTLNNSEESSYLTDQNNDQQEDRLLRQELQQNTETKPKSKKKPGEYFVYDLKSQNEEKKQKIVKQPEFKVFSTKILSLEQSRRVHSLGNQRSQQKHRQDMIIRRQHPIKNSNDRFAKSPPNMIQTKSLKTIKPIVSQTRKSSKHYFALQQSIDKSPNSTINSKNLLVDSRKLKLPEINAFSGNSRSLKKLSPINHEKLKTQKIYEQQDIQYAIGKKLVTEATDSGKKTVKGIQKYLRDLQAEKQQILMNNQGGRMMKKQREHDKRKLNMQLLKTAKHSLKRQIQ